MTSLPASDRLDPELGRLRLTTQYESGLLGVRADGLRLTWSAEASGAAGGQVGYQVSVDGAELDPVTSTDSIGIAAPGTALGARQTRSIRVRIATADGWSTWSEPVTAEAGLTPNDWHARVIGVPSEVEGPAQLLRHEFTLDSAPQTARLYSSYLGIGEIWINGQKAGDEHLAPGWTSYGSRVLVSTIDVAALLVEGPNAIVAHVADGWYRGRMGFRNLTEIYGNRSGAIAQLEVQTAEGSVEIVTDASWRAGFGAVRSASIYDGTALDLSMTSAAEASIVGFDESTWGPVEVIPFDHARLAPRIAPPVRTVLERPMSREVRSASTVLDSGQNVSGWVRVTVSGEAGDTVTVRHAEILDQGISISACSASAGR